jgi:hypothetical protein
MPLFCLTPLASGLGDPDWSASLLRGPCYVVARDARLARLYAANSFANAAASRSAGGLLPASPWLRSDLVSVDRAIGPVAAATLEGSVMLRESARDRGEADASQVNG